MGTGRTFPQRRAFTGVYTIVIMVALVSFCSLAVDWGRVQVVKTELRRAADAAVRAAAADLPNGISTATNSAVSIAGLNTADGSSVVLDPTSDVQFGTWDSTAKTFTVLTGSSASSANAVRVTARRLASRGTAVPLIFAQLIGRPTQDVQASAIALPGKAAQSTYGVTALNQVNTSGGVFDSYNSASGSYSSSSALSHVSLASIGNVTMSGSSTIRGNAYLGPGSSLSGGSITGSVGTIADTTLFATLASFPIANSYDNSPLPSGYYNGTDWSMSGGSCTLPAGTYVVNNFSMSGTSQVHITGRTTIYVTGTVSLSGSALLAGSRPSDLNFVMVSTNNINLSGSSSILGAVYVPGSTISLSSSAGIYGTLLAYNIKISGSAGVHQDESMAGSGGSSGSGVSIVQ